MVITKEKRNDFVKWLDDIVDFTKIIKNKLVAQGAELVDGLFFGLGVDYLNEEVNIPEKFHNNINAVIDACLTNDYQLIIDTVPDLQQDLRNIKALNDELETRWVATNLEATIEVIQYWAQKKKEQ